MESSMTYCSGCVALERDRDKAREILHIAVRLKLKAQEECDVLRARLAVDGLDNEDETLP